MNWQDYITADPAVLVGKPVIRGTRLAVEFILGDRGRASGQAHRPLQECRPGTRGGANNLFDKYWHVHSRGGFFGRLAAGPPRQVYGSVGLNMRF